MNKIGKKVILVAFLFLTQLAAMGSENGRKYVSPYYFGPYAFPVPDMADRPYSSLHAEISGDYIRGERGDVTKGLIAQLNIPLWSQRANLSLWLPVREWYNWGESCGKWDVDDAYRNQSIRGSGTGDVYVSTEMLLFEEAEICPDVTLRAALKTASGEQSHINRFYDSPGYYFDATAAKTFLLTPYLSLRLAVSGGFLCWQTAVNVQNDAPMYGVSATLRYDRFSFGGSMGGYAGWQSIQDAAVKDSPIVLRAKMSYRVKSIEFSTRYEYGCKDFPYTGVRVGCGYDF